MANMLETATEAIRNAFCLATEATDRYWNTFLPSELSGFSPFAETGMAYRFFCNREPPSLPESAQGGQCPTLYTVTIRIRIFNTVTNDYDADSTIAPNVYGRIGGLKTVSTGTVRTTYLIHGTFDNPDAQVESFVAASDANVTTHDRTRIVSIARFDGLPDNCGSNPPPLVNPNPGSPNFSAPINITYNDNSSSVVVLGGVVAFGAAYIDADLNLSVPFTLNLNGNFNIPIRGTINLNGGDINFNLGGSDSGNGGGSCKDATKNFDTDPMPDGGDDDSIDVDPSNPQDEDAPIRKLLRGVICYVSGSSPRVTSVPQSSTQDLIVPRAGNVQFLVQVGNTMAWTEDKPVRCNRELIVCDWPGGAVDVRCSAYSGYTVTLQRVYYPSRGVDI